MKSTDARTPSLRRLLRSAGRGQRPDAALHARLQVGMFRLSPRQRSIVARYDLDHEFVVDYNENLPLDAEVPWQAQYVEPING
jgi:hypothetical protein